jgi:putative NADH-flavin reductase
MRVAILGATGGVGRWLMAVAREDGDHVKILVRDRSKLPKDLGAIGIIRGDALDPAAVDATIAGTDVVLSALGAQGFGKTDVYSAGAANIITAMKAHGASRLLAVSSVGVEEDPGAPFLLKRIVAPFFLRNVLADMRLMEREIENSGLVWTIVRAARLTDGPRTGLYRAGERLIPENGGSISRADVADFMVEACESTTWVGKGVQLGG